MGHDSDPGAVLEPLWVGESHDDPSEHEAARSLAAAVAQAQGLQPFSPALQHLLATVSRQEFTVEEIAAIIARDTTLAARVMRMVNSAAYGLRRRCTSIGHAVALLGANAIGEMSAAIAIHDMFRGTTGHAAGISAHCASVATLTRVFSDRCAIEDSDALFTCGLLHDVGKLLLLQVNKQSKTMGSYPKLLDAAGPRPDVCHERERDLYGFDHAILGGHVLAAWQIPAPIPQVVASHHQPDRAYGEPGAIPKMVATIRLADRIAYLRDAPEGDEAWSVMLSEATEVLGLDRATIEAWWPDLVRAAESPVWDH